MANPILIIKEITDLYLRKNFQALRDYFDKQNQLLDFKFFEQKFAAATDNFKIAHGLGYAPDDVIVTKITGSGVVTFNVGLFDDQNIDLSVDGPCLVRFFVGSYWNAPPSEKSTTDLIRFSNNDSAIAIPTGTILNFAGTVVPSGYLLCDGSSYLQTKYASLFSAIGISFGSPSPGLFCVPDLRGRFLRGRDGGAGNDPDAATRQSVNGSNAGDAVGSYQDDCIQNITGSFSANSVQAALSNYNGTGPFATLSLGGNFSFAGGGGNPNTWGFYSFDASRAVRTSTETRPKNVNVNFIIKT
jgi:microcystin-dependent protein